LGGGFFGKWAIDVTNRFERDRKIIHCWQEIAVGMGAHADDSDFQPPVELSLIRHVRGVLEGSAKSDNSATITEKALPSRDNWNGEEARLAKAAPLYA
jgi:hypothetical protein